MIVLEDGANTVRIILADKATLTSPMYVFLFVNDNTGEKYMVYNTYTTVETELQQFTLTVQATPNWLIGQVALGKLGFYHYYVYEYDDTNGNGDPGGLDYDTVIAADISTYVPTYFTSLVAEGKMEYQDSTLPTINTYKNTVAAVKAYGD